MKTWLQSAAAAAKITAFGCYAVALAITAWHVGAWLSGFVGVVPAILLGLFIVFCILTVTIRIGSRVRAQARAEMEAEQVEHDARRAKLDAKIRRAHEMTAQAQRWRPDASVH